MDSFGKRVWGFEGRESVGRWGEGNCLGFVGIYG